MGNSYEVPILLKSSLNPTCYLLELAIPTYTRLSGASIDVIIEVITQGLIGLCDR